MPKTQYFWTTQGGTGCELVNSTSNTHTIILPSTVICYHSLGCVSLGRIVLHWNRLEGTLPVAMHELAKLRQLILNYNQLRHGRVEILSQCQMESNQLYPQEFGLTRKTNPHNVRLSSSLLRTQIGHMKDNNLIK